MYDSFSGAMNVIVCDRFPSYHSDCAIFFIKLDITENTEIMKPTHIHPRSLPQP